MKKLLLVPVLMLAFGLSAVAQISFEKDTVLHYLVEGEETTSKVLVLNSGQTPIKGMYRIFFDDVKSQTDWAVQFCDCDVCRVNYPNSSTCATDVTSENPYLFKLYVNPAQNITTAYFKMKVMDSMDTTQADTVVFKTVMSTSVPQINLHHSEIRLVPNPAEGNTRLNFSLNTTADVKINVINFLGETISEYSIDSAYGDIEQNIDLNEQESGIYFVNIIVGDKVYSKRLSLR
ncbi:T9SS type A sorting domain-containing protein [bacterium SCSIO 12741]|nr:T9SS type A sorting domain-containing protein [bacterium SCSIO 12741]